MFAREPARFARSFRVFCHLLHASSIIMSKVRAVASSAGLLSTILRLLVCMAHDSMPSQLPCRDASCRSIGVKCSHRPCIDTRSRIIARTAFRYLLDFEVLVLHYPVDCGLLELTCPCRWGFDPRPRRRVRKGEASHSFAI